MFIDIVHSSKKRNKANIPWYVIANLMEIKDNEEILKRAREGRRHITFNNKTFSLRNKGILSTALPYFPMSMLDKRVPHSFSKKWSRSSDTESSQVLLKTALIMNTQMCTKRRIGWINYSFSLDLGFKSLNFLAVSPI